MKVMDKMLQDHQEKSKCEPKDVYLMAMSLYSKHLQELETRDINSLKKKISEMQRMKNDLLRDLEEEKATEITLLT